MLAPLCRTVFILAEDDVQHKLYDLSGRVIFVDFFPTRTGDFPALTRVRDAKYSGFFDNFLRFLEWFQQLGWLLVPGLGWSWSREV